MLFLEEELLIGDLGLKIYSMAKDYFATVTHEQLEENFEKEKYYELEKKDCKNSLDVGEENTETDR